MGNWDAAVMALIGMSAIGFLLADGERRRIKWIQAMRRCLLRLSDMIRYEKRGVWMLLTEMDLRATPQEKMLTRLLHACAARMQESGMRIGMAFAQESARVQEYGVLSMEDKEPFERVIGGLGEAALGEQLRLIDEADEQLRRREQALTKDAVQRGRLVRTLGVCGGMAMFLLLI